MNSVKKTLGELRDIARNIGHKWKRNGYDYQCFPQIVLEHSNSLDLTPLGSLDATCSLLDDPDVAALQATNTFSDLYLKLYDNGYFWVEILNWWNSDINIHDHDFSAVQFQARGKSLNVTYAFEQEAKVGGVRLGSIRVLTTEVWNEGNRSVTLPGSPHTVKHLSLPTVSVLIRTHPGKAYGPQQNYFPPGVVASYGIADVIFRKRVKALRLLSQGNRAEFHTAFRAFIKRQSPEGALFTLIKMIDIIFEAEHVDLIHEYADRSSETVKRIVEAVAFYRTTDLLLKNLSVSNEFSEREALFLAVLSCSFDHESFCKIIKGHFGDCHRPSAVETLDGLASRVGANDLQVVKNALELFGLREFLPRVAKPSHTQ